MKLETLAQVPSKHVFTLQEQTEQQSTECSRMEIPSISIRFSNFIKSTLWELSQLFPHTIFPQTLLYEKYWQILFPFWISVQNLLNFGLAAITTPWKLAALFIFFFQCKFKDIGKIFPFLLFQMCYNLKKRIGSSSSFSIIWSVAR